MVDSRFPVVFINGFDSLMAPFSWKRGSTPTEGADPVSASPADVTAGASAGLTSTGPGKGMPRAVIDPVKKTTIGRPRGDAPGNRPYLNQPAAAPPQ